MPASPRFSRSRRGVALVVVLSFIVLLTVVVVAYFSRVLSNRQSANDSFNGGKTDQLARSALDVIVSDFKQEIANGSTATTINGVATYYPIKADGTLQRANMVPMRSGTADTLPNLIRRSVRDNGPVGANPMPAPGIPSRASALNSTTDPSVNGRLITKARWNQHFLLPQQNASGSSAEPATAFTAPDWVMMTKEQGPVTLASPTKDTGGNPVTVVGRYAYAVYDEGGLLDANVVGFPSASTPAQVGGKTSLGLADLPTALSTAMPSPAFSQTPDMDKLVGWRNFATTHPTGVFPNPGFAANLQSDPATATRYFTSLQTNTSGFLRTSNSSWQGRTDQAFLSRQQLIAYQKASGFPAGALQYLGTFSRELNAPSWGPTQNAADLGGNAVFPYKDDREKPYSANRLLPGVRHTRTGTVTAYRSDGTAYTYAVKPGDLLVQRRFPLGRLAWLGPSGPRAPGTAENVKACFGLSWSGAGWRYDVVAPDLTDPANLSTTSSAMALIKKLGSVATEANPREPNFFELLQAGMLSGSLAMDGQDTSTFQKEQLFSYFTKYEQWPELHIFRIGASIITQSQQLDPTDTTAKYYPTVIQYKRNGVDVQAVGVDDLPYLNMFTMIGGKNATGNVGLYSIFGLWNPHQIGSEPARPLVRLCAEGQIIVENRYGSYPEGQVLVYVYSYSGYAHTLNTKIELLSGMPGAGVNGFADPHALRGTDIPAGLGPGDSNGKMWATLPQFQDGTIYAGYRFPDFSIDTTKKAAKPADVSYANTFCYSGIWFWVNTNLAQPFNCWLEYYHTPSGTWIPYTYHAGIDHISPWLSKSPGTQAAYMGQTYPTGTQQGDPVDGLPPAPNSVDPPAGLSIFYYIHNPWFNVDPRALRFNYTQGQTSSKVPTPPVPPATSKTADGLAFLNSSIWSQPTPDGDQVNSSGTLLGRAGPQNAQTIFTAPWNPASLARNNTTPLNPTYPIPATGVSDKTRPSAYYDPDGVQRIADSGLFTTAINSANSWKGDPYALAAASGTSVPTDVRVSDRPIMLHRPFNNVAELGYVSRDYPWRTLDFFTAKSADTGLLDLFTATQNDERVGAGRINLNTRNIPALNAMLTGSITDILPTPPVTLSNLKAVAIATKLAAHTAMTDYTLGGPLIGKDEIVTRFLSKLSSGAFSISSSDFKSEDEQNIKARREAVTRAFAETGQTRTWNLLIDVVAQSGRYPVGATSLAGFNVEGERHYWLHVAIDRFTGEVIDQQLEAVTE